MSPLRDALLDLENQAVTNVLTTSTVNSLSVLAISISPFELFQPHADTTIIKEDMESNKQYNKSVNRIKEGG